MCTQFTPTRNDRWVHEHLGVHLPTQPYPAEVFPGYAAPMVRLNEQRQVTCTLARFGLIPHWAKDGQDATRLGRKTYNARSETVADKPSYRTPWQRRQFAIALLDDFFEPNWETGKAVRWRIQRTDGQPMGVASLWEHWTDSATGEIITSFTMLTVNADGHPVMGRFHRPGDEKRSVVVLAPEQFGGWLNAVDPGAWMQRPSDGVLSGEPVRPDGPATSGAEEPRSLSLF